MRTLLCCVAVLAIHCPFSPGASAKTIIDSFTSGAVEITTPNESARPYEASVVQDQLEGVLGGYRRLIISTGVGTMRVTTEDNGVLHVSGGAAEVFEVKYGRTFEPLNLDLTDPSTSILAVDFSHFDPATGPGDRNPSLELRFLTDANPLPTDLQLEVDLSRPGPQTVSFPLADLSGRGNLADVDVISIEYGRSKAGFAFEINEIAFVPEPSGIVLIIVGGLFCLLAWSRSC